MALIELKSRLKAHEERVGEHLNQLGQFCVRICVRKTFQNMLKRAKIGKDLKKQK